MKFDVILDSNDPDFGDKLRAALGLEAGDTLQIITPQFKRTDGRVISYFPNTPEEYAALPKLDDETLQKIGCQIWDREDGKTTWLFPGEWYDHIPNGTKVVSICGGEESFVKGETDDDTRFGALAYGFIKEG